MSAVYLEKLRLINYRNFRTFDLDINEKFILILGDNGVGKTNILESLSFLSPGRGFYSVKLNQICLEGTDNSIISVLLNSALGRGEISININLSNNKRVSEFNGSIIRNNELKNFLSVFWLTSGMHRIFTTSLVDRRRFLDRIVYNFIQSHGKLVSVYETLLAERNKLFLLDGGYDKKLLILLEEKIFNLSTEISKNRIQIINTLNDIISRSENIFPKAILSINNTLEKDSISKGFIRQNYNDIPKAYLANFLVMHKEKKQLAKFCSTGEQKALLISIMLAQIKYTIQKSGHSPILLLDEGFVHLDKKRKESLIEILKELNIQTWITANDSYGLNQITKSALIVKL